MTKILDKLFAENSLIYNDVINLIIFLSNIFNEYNEKITKQTRKIDFYDLFFYMLRYNSSNNETHLTTIYNFNTKNNKNISENAFINRLIKLDPNYIKDIIVSSV